MPKICLLYTSIPRETASFISSRMSKNFRIPEGFTSWMRLERMES